MPKPLFIFKIKSITRAKLEKKLKKWLKVIKRIGMRTNVSLDTLYHI